MDFDFDMTFQFFGTTDLPGPEQEFYWGSRFAYERYTVNVPGVQDPAVDDLVSRIGCATSRKELISATRALDRVIAWNGYLLPGWYMAFVSLCLLGQVRSSRLSDGTGNRPGSGLPRYRGLVGQVRCYSACKVGSSTILMTSVIRQPSL